MKQRLSEPRWWWWWSRFTHGRSSNYTLRLNVSNFTQIWTHTFTWRLIQPTLSHLDRKWLHSARHKVKFLTPHTHTHTRWRGRKKGGNKREKEREDVVNLLALVGTHGVKVFACGRQMISLMSPPLRAAFTAALGVVRVCRCCCFFFQVDQQESAGPSVSPSVQQLEQLTDLTGEEISSTLRIKSNAWDTIRAHIVLGRSRPSSADILLEFNLPFFLKKEVKIKVGGWLQCLAGSVCGQTERRSVSFSIFKVPSLLLRDATRGVEVRKLLLGGWRTKHWETCQMVSMLFLFASEKKETH